MRIRSLFPLQGRIKEGSNKTTLTSLNRPLPSIPLQGEGTGVPPFQLLRLTRLTILSTIAVALFLTSTSIFAQAPFAIGQVHYGGGGDWYSSAQAIANWLGEIKTRVGIPTENETRVVKLSDRDLYRTPFITINGHGNVRFTDAEVVALRRYLTGGGFLFVNDDYGLDDSIRRELNRVFPSNPFQPIPASHPVYHCFYDLAGLPKIHEHDGDNAQGFGIFVNGRMVVYYAWSSDIGDGLEAYEVHKVPDAAREAAARMATNLIVYALTH